MLSTVTSMGLLGIDGYRVLVEVNVSFGVPGFEIVGLPDAAVRESRERVRGALKNLSLGFPEDKITVNLAPAGLKKEGAVYDLPIAVGILCSMGRLPAVSIEDTAILGELSLSGEVRGVRGALSMVIAARESGMKRIILPAENVKEAASVEGIEIYAADNLMTVYEHLSGKTPLRPMDVIPYEQLMARPFTGVDFADIRGQKKAKRALEIAAAGGHNVLLIGPPGSGKTLLSRAFAGILPQMTFAEAMEVTRIHSASGALPEGLMTERPFRAPHHSASHAALVGGGPHALPGEISRAHHGVLFLDELPEYKKDVLEALRQPMEDGVVTVVRVNAQSTYPSQFMLVCAMNPCPCGNFGAKDRVCRCSQMDIRRYLGKISGPLLDRIDMHIEVESIAPAALGEAEPDGESSLEVRARVSAARKLQAERYQGVISSNARLDARTLNKFCKMTDAARQLLNTASERMSLSNRAYTRVIKLARTIADLAGEELISENHIAEAVQYRALDKKYWGQ